MFIDNTNKSNTNNISGQYDGENNATLFSGSINGVGKSPTPHYVYICSNLE